MLKHSKIVILGGPGTGKSSLINEFTKRGYHCLPEISREIIKKAQEEGVEQLFLTDPLLFSKKLLEGRIQQFKEAEKINGNIFIDRGIPDITAYMDFKQESYPAEFIEANRKHTYNSAFILPVWPEIYTSDNERYESLEEAYAIEKHLQKTYTNLGYNLIRVPKASVNERVNFILEHIKKIL